MPDWVLSRTEVEAAVVPYTPMKHAALATGAETLLQGFADGNELSVSRMWDFCHMARETPVALVQMGGCQDYGPFLGTLNISCRSIIGIQKGTAILTTTQIYP